MSNFTRVYFPGLGIDFDLPSVAFTIGSYDIHFYGIIIAFGFMLAVLYGGRMAYKWRMSLDGMTDVLIWGTVFGIVCARAYYVIFEWDMYKDNLLQIFNLRAGGLAIYGGVIGAVLTLIVFTRKRKVSFFSMADSGVLGLITGQIIGRWGNFFNCEAFGGYTDSLLAMRIKRSLVNENMLNGDVLNHLIVENGVEYIQVHPTFLYESLWNLGLLMFMLWYRKRKKFDGEMLWIYLVGYGLGRFWIEGLRTDQLILFGTGIAVSQGLSLILVLASVGVLIYHYCRLFKRQKEKTSDGDIQGRTGSKD